jgi:hypothetical protein
MFSALNAIEIGKEFHYQNKDKLIVNRTTIEEVNKYFGEPVKDIVTDNVNGHFNIYEYYFVHADLTDGDERILMMEFKNGVLIGYVYDSSYKEDSTLFDYEEADGIEIGHHIDDVLKRVGSPSGKALCPVNIHDYKDKCIYGKKMFVWIYTPGTSMFGASSVETKMLFVGLDENALVSDISHYIQVGGGE